MKSDAGLQVHAHSYFEVEDKKTGEVSNNITFLFVVHISSLNKYLDLGNNVNLFLDTYK